MLLGKAVEADRDGVQSGPQQTFEPGRSQRQTVGNHAPGILPAIELQPDLLQIPAHQHLATRQDDQQAVGIHVRSDLGVEHPEEIRGGAYPLCPPPCDSRSRSGGS